jgi:light-regulated signal transduction histidine kinase (bacteriophytochrome)
MHQLIEDVLAYSGVNHNTDQTKNNQLISDIVKEVETCISGTIEQNNVKVVTKYLPKVKANFSQVFLLIKNLIENGITYNERENPIITITGSIKNNMCEINVTDNGIGIEKKYHD